MAGSDVRGEAAGMPGESGTAQADAHGALATLPVPEALEVFGTVAAFVQGTLSSRDAVALLGIRDHADLLRLVGRAGFGLPTLPHEELEAQAETFVQVWMTCGDR